MSDKSNLKSAKNKSKEKEADQQNKKHAFNSFFDKHLNIFFFLSLLACIVFSVLLFDIKMSVGEDDSGYILQAKRFIDGVAFPSWHGPLYSIFLSLPLLIFGVNIVILKITSLLFIAGHLIVLYFAVRKKVNSVIVAFTIVLTSVNASVLYFSSHTYNEAFYMFLQSLLLLFMIPVLDYLAKDDHQKFNWKIYLPLGLAVFLMSLAKNIGIVALIAVILYLLLDKKFIPALYAFLSFLVFRLPYELYRRIVWGETTAQMKGQFSEILNINAYNAAAGKEDFSGMVTRYFDNLEAYLSKHFLNAILLRNPENTDASLLPAILLIVLFCVGLVLAFRKNKTVFFIGLYLLLATNATFIVLQQSWSQPRMIVIYIPMIILFLTWTLWEISQIKKFGFVKYLLFFLVIFIFFKTLGEAARKAQTNQKYLSKNIAGNKYYGFTPDWVNFLKMSEWVGENLPDDVRVASRKPSLSFIYSKGKEFYGIYRMPLENGDSIIDRFKKERRNVCIFDLTGLNNKNLPGQALFLLRRSVDAVIGQNNGLYGIHQFDNAIDNPVVNICQEYGIQNYLEPDTFRKVLRQGKENYYGVYPDSLLNNLRKNNVDYVIMANLRMNPNMKTNRTINTIRRYLYYIEIKYFNLFTVVKQIGESDDEPEPAQLIKINYEYAGF